MRTLLLLTGAALFLFCGSCSSLKRYRAARYKGEVHGLVSIDLFGTQLQSPLPEHSGQNLWDLSASAQTQMIRILHERFPENRQFLQAMERQYQQEVSVPLADHTARDLKMVFSIRRNRDYATLGKAGSRFSPADRLEHVRFSVTLPGEIPLRFTGWNRFATEYGEIEVGDVSFTRSLTLDAETSGQTGRASVRGALSGSEEQTVRQRYLVLNGTLAPGRIEMEEEGMRGVDLAGNVSAEVSLEFEGFPERVIRPVYGEPGTAGGTRPLLLTFEDILVPRMEEAPDSITAILRLEYVYRHVASGEKTFAEWDDRVKYYRGTEQKQVLLFRKKEVVPPLFCLGEYAGSGRKVRVRDPFGKTYPCQFESYPMAKRFLGWLLEAPGSGQATVNAGEHILMWGDSPLAPADVEQLKILPVY